MTHTRDVLLHATQSTLPPQAQREIEDACAVCVRAMATIARKKENEVPLPQLRREAIAAMAERVERALSPEAFAVVLPMLVELVRHLDAIDPAVDAWAGLHRTNERGEYTAATVLFAKFEARAVALALVETVTPA